MPPAPTRRVHPLPASPLFILLIFVLLPLSLPSPSLANVIPPRIRQEDEGPRPTVAAILDADLTDNNNQPCCQNLSRFDIFARLVHQADVFPILQAPDPITLFAPDDRAVYQTAKDLAPFLNIPIPQSEPDAYAIITTFVDQFRNPETVLRDIVRFHIIKQSQSFDELANGLHETCLPNQPIESSGITLGPPNPRIDFGEQAQVIITSQLQGSNGFLFAVDRLILPDLFPYPLKPSSPLTTVFNTSQTPHPTIPPDTAGPPPSNETGVVDFPAPVLTSTSPTPTPSTPSQNPNTPACFPASALVTLHDHTQLPLVNLHAGHLVRATEFKSSPVYLFTHRQPSLSHRFIRISSTHNHTIHLSPGHYLYANGRLKPAAHVRIGDSLRTLDGPSTVKSIRWTLAKGLIAPHTMHGDIVIDRVVASTYTTAVHPTIAHAFLWPIRALVHAGVSVEPLGSLFYGTRAGVGRWVMRWGGG